MERFAGFVVRHSGRVLLAVLALTVLAAVRLPLDYDDDVVRFLPQDDPEVVRFNEISDRFGSLQVALVGVQSTDIFTHERLSYVRALTEAIQRLPEVDHATSVTELAVVQGEDEGDHRALVPHPIPDTPEGLDRVRDYVMGLDYMVGKTVSADGGSAMLIVQLRQTVQGAPISAMKAAIAVRAAAAAVARPGDVTLHFGGAPFIAEAAAVGSQEDLARLAPYVLAIILLIILATLGSLRAALVTVAAVGLGILWTLGLMAWLGEPLTLVSSSLPVILVALGSAYAVHLLVWYREHDADVRGMLVNMGGPVLVTAATTMAGFISFLVMDLAPMRAFGWQMAVGTGVCALVSLAVIPAVLTRFPLPSTEASAAARWVDQGLEWLAVRSLRARAPVLLVTVAIGAFFATQLPNIETRMDTQAFFEDGSEPARADAFMAERFGGSVYLQVLVAGDLRDPAVAHRLAGFLDRLRAVEGVTRVDGITDVLAIVEEGLKGKRRLSHKRAELTQFGFLAERSNPAVRLLVDPQWQGALVQVGIGSFDTGVVEPITARIRALADEHLPKHARAVARGPAHEAEVLRDAAERIGLLAGLDAPAVERIRAALGGGGDAAQEAAMVKAVRAVLEREVVEDEMIVLDEDADLDKLAATVADAVAALSLTPERFVALVTPLADPSELDEKAAFVKGARYVHTRVMKAAEPLATGAAQGAVKALVGPQPEATRLRVEAIVAEVLSPTWYVDSDAPVVAGAAPLGVTVSGHPILQEAMTRSVQHNQEFSLLVSLPLVLVIMVLVFRNLWVGLIGMLPTSLTLLVTFGLMGLFSEELPLDIASSMLASIALGVGIDYAIHFIWRYREGGLRTAMRTTGRSIVINAAEITAGFLVLVFATIVPMSRFGLLTAQTLFVAAAATLILLPALLGWWRPQSHAITEPETGAKEPGGEAWKQVAASTKPVSSP